MHQSQDIGNIRRDLILKVLLAQRTASSPAQQVGVTRIQRELLDGSRARIQTRRKP
jgi:hypothetical protein